MRPVIRRGSAAPRARPPARPPRRDPAPSRAAYRLRRLWMRRWVRRAAVRGGPALILAGALAGWLGDGREIAAAREGWAELRREIEARPEFAVTEARVEGAGADLEPAVRALLPRLPSSSLRLDLEAIRAAVAALPPVARAELRVAPGGVLAVRVEERRAAAVWRSAEGLVALDARGLAIRTLADRGARSELPLVVGEGADRAVPEALALHEAAGPLAPRLRGLVRVGDRRWDAVLAGGLRLMLPERGAEAAMERAARLDAEGDVLARDLTHLDLRDPARLVARVGATSRDDLALVLAVERAGPLAGEGSAE